MLGVQVTVATPPASVVVQASIGASSAIGRSIAGVHGTGAVDDPSAARAATEYSWRTPVETGSWNDWVGASIRPRQYGVLPSTLRETTWVTASLPGSQVIVAVRGRLAHGRFGGRGRARFRRGQVGGQVDRIATGNRHRFLASGVTEPDAMGRDAVVGHGLDEGDVGRVDSAPPVPVSAVDTAFDDGGVDAGAVLPFDGDGQALGVGGTRCGRRRCRGRRSGRSGPGLVAQAEQVMGRSLGAARRGRGVEPTGSPETAVGSG